MYESDKEDMEVHPKPSSSAGQRHDAMRVWVSVYRKSVAPKRSGGSRSEDAMVEKEGQISRIVTTMMVIGYMVSMGGANGGNAKSGLEKGERVKTSRESIRNALQGLATSASTAVVAFAAGFSRCFDGGGVGRSGGAMAVGLTASSSLAAAVASASLTGTAAACASPIGVRGAADASVVVPSAC